MKHSLELLLRDVSLSQNVVVYEELSQSDSVLLHDRLDLLHEGHQLSVSLELPLSSSVVSALNGCVQGVGWLGCIQEFQIFDVVVLVSVDLLNRLHLLVTQSEANGG